MASREAEALKTLYRGWAAALAANPEMPLDELRLMFEHWGDVTAEPGGLITSRRMRAVYRRCGRFQRDAQRTGFCCACMVAATSRRRCTRIAKSMAIWPRRSAAGP